MKRTLQLLAIAGLGSFITVNALAGQGLDFMAGHWCQTSDNGYVEETWLPPVGGETLGMGRTVKGEKGVAFEFLRIIQVDGQATYIAQPGGGQPVEFTRTDGGEGWVRFENPQHDFPTRVQYEGDGNALKATIWGPGKNGAEMSIPFVYEPCADR